MTNPEKTNPEITRLQTLRDLQLDSICQLKKRNAFWKNLLNKIATKSHKVNRQLSATVKAYNQTDYQLAELDGRLKICKAAKSEKKKDPTSKQRKIEKNLTDIGLSQAQIERIVQAVLN